ncbi:protoporphyrinogen oxidase [Dactylosporangium matsuzakiense]|uniref:Coproporphyrinogen III oxidase n=1 Tax=Dactylosporangium matsuzakiense TaxID=53360 RepID=A0A9W6KRA5_9ACTN|nr:protoporphyrinogen oxidase [Dactylosporangium matsuzakiense]UWZ46524.1 protoporphyrinogen oxidase [Dactylosporangium matsuzakiense]GLL06662.1 protoporphyrinogen oxidase [Dactylosporangium matsuzakiense]
MNKRVVVVGGGIAGLAAAHRLHTLRPDLDVVLLDQRDRPGGKLSTGELAGRPVERGAESFLVGGPSAAIELAREVGLGDAVVHPTGAKAAVAINGVLQDLPTGTLMGIPLQGAEEAAATPILGTDRDVSVGELIRPRRGDEVVDHFVEPLLGGVYAGRADRLSVRMALPALAKAAEHHTTLSAALAEATAPSAGREPGAPIFGAIDGGMSRLVDAITATLPDVRTNTTVRELEQHNGGWRLTTGPTRDPRTLDADAVILAVPAAPAARLLRRAIDLEYASIALVALVLPSTKLPDLSGFLVPATEGLTIKAVTFFDRKWAHLRRPDTTILRASIGRHGDEEQLQRTDEELKDRVRTEVARLIGVDALPEELAFGVYRWGGALPQYAPGHQARIRALRESLQDTAPIAVAGAAYDGVGIPACITSGRTAAAAVLARLGE